MYRFWIDFLPVFGVYIYVWWLGMGFVYHKNHVFYA